MTTVPPSVPPDSLLPDAVPPRRRNRGRRWLQLALTVAAVVGLVLLVDLGATVEVLARVRIGWIASAVAVAFADRLFMVGKWFLLARVQDPLLRLADAVRVYLASSFAAFFLPASVGGDVLRAIALGRRSSRVPELGASVVAERMLGLIAGGLVALLAALIALRQLPDAPVVLAWAGTAFAVSIGVGVLPVWLVRSRRVRRWFDSVPSGSWQRPIIRMAAGYAEYSNRLPLLGGVGLLTLVEQFAPILVFWLLVRAAEVPVTAPMLLVAVPLALFLVRLPISVAGIGLAEGGQVYVLTQFGVPPPEALALALLGRVVELLGTLPGAVWLTDLLPRGTGRGGSPDATPATTVDGERARPPAPPAEPLTPRLRED